MCEHNCRDHTEIPEFTEPAGPSPTTDPELTERFRGEGRWQRRTIRDVLDQAAAEHPDREALVGHRTVGGTVRWSYRDLDREATKAASALVSVGVRPGDAVAVMLPNWVEYVALIFGTAELGAVYTGIPVAYGEMQALAILRRSRARVLVIPRRWRSNSHLELSRRLRRQVPTLERVLVVDDDGDGLADAEILWSSLAGAPRHDLPRPGPDDLCYLGFTSGTTGEPKGAMHTHETLMHSVRQFGEHLGSEVFGGPMRQLVVSPTGHHTGFVWGVLFTVHLHGTGVHVDRWDPAWGIDVIRREAVTAFFGAPTFLQDMMRTDLAGDPDCPLRCVVIAGSSVPRNLPETAARSLGAYVAPAWGMTECSIIVSCTPAESDEILRTDGSVFDGSEARVVDAEGSDVATGRIGELVVRGPSLFLGYLDRPDATQESFLPGGWFRTGDSASVDEHGWVSLRGRTKDIVIRGGENIPVTDVETVLFDHPDVLSAAVVGVPDDRLGERACAVVVLRPGSSVDLPSMCDFLVGRGLSRHYLPERLLVLPEMPMTQSGKIQKFRLREMAAGQ